MPLQDSVKAEIHGNTKLPYVFCFKCKQWTPAQIDTFKKKGIPDLDVITCGKCEIVQNWDRIPKFKYMRYSEVKKLGWKVYKENAT